MTNTERHKRLEQFFGAYFHEDWDVEASDWTAIVAAFAAHASPEDCKQLADDVMWVATRSDAAAFLFEQLGCYYDPRADGLSVTDWLSDLAERLASSTATQ